MIDDLTGDLPQSLVSSADWQWVDAEKMEAKWMRLRRRRRVLGSTNTGSTCMANIQRGGDREALTALVSWLESLTLH